MQSFVAHAVGISTRQAIRDPLRRDCRCSKDQTPAAARNTKRRLTISQQAITPTVPVVAVMHNIINTIHPPLCATHVYEKETFPFSESVYAPIEHGIPVQRLVN